MSKPIDFVILWVDNNDLEWQLDRAKYSSIKQLDFAGEDVRYRDWKILKYWFRGVERFTPWVNKIHFVTYGHLPSWLNTKHPKLNIIEHGQYINKEYLPTFSSHTIELNIHNIPGLSEQFVYFNDDTFIINRMEKEDFFVNDLPCDEAVFAHPFAYSYEDEFYHYVMNCNAIINDNFDFKTQLQLHLSKFMNEKYMEQISTNEFYSKYRDFSGFYTVHLPQTYLKSTFEEVWASCSEVLERTCHNRFRSSKDVSAYLMRYWQLITGNFEPTYWRKKGWAFNLSQDITRITEFIRDQERPMVCLNDSANITDFNKVQNSLDQAFQQILPLKSKFEI